MLCPPELERARIRHLQIEAASYLARAVDLMMTERAGDCSDCSDCSHPVVACTWKSIMQAVACPPVHTCTSSPWVKTIMMGGYGFRVRPSE